MNRLEIAEKIIEDVEVWMVLGIARDAHPQAIQNAVEMHNRIRDFLGKPHVNWHDVIEKQRKVWAA